MITCSQLENGKNGGVGREGFAGGEGAYKVFVEEDNVKKMKRNCTISCALSLRRALKWIIKCKLPRVICHVM